jgi:hypothetical protein
VAALQRCNPLLTNNGPDVQDFVLKWPDLRTAFGERAPGDMKGLSSTQPTSKWRGRADELRLVAGIYPSAKWLVRWLKMVIMEYGPFSFA